MSDGFLVYTYPQSHRVVYFKYVQLFTCQSHPSEVVLKNTAFFPHNKTNIKQKP